MVPLALHVLLFLHKVANHTTLQPHLVLIVFILKATNMNVRADRVLTTELDTLLYSIFSETVDNFFYHQPD